MKKKLVKVCEVLGRDIKKQGKNQLPFYIYNDGSVEKNYFTEKNTILVQLIQKENNR